MNLTIERDSSTMANRSVIHSTFVIERSYSANPERVFAAFADPAAKRRWYGEHESMSMEEFRMDFRVGGHDYARYTFGPNSPFPGATLVNNTVYQDIVPQRRIVIAYTMAIGDNRFSASQATFEFVPSAQGTGLIFTEQGAFFEGADGPQMREAGWRKLLDKLAGWLER